MKVDLAEFLTQFQDHLAPRLDTYEQAVYWYVEFEDRLAQRARLRSGQPVPEVSGS
jgi:hypothetical protein